MNQQLVSKNIECHNHSLKQLRNPLCLKKEQQIKINNFYVNPVRHQWSIPTQSALQIPLGWDGGGASSFPYYFCPPLPLYRQVQGYVNHDCSL